MTSNAIDILHRLRDLNRPTSAAGLIDREEESSDEDGDATITSLNSLQQTKDVSSVRKIRGQSHVYLGPCNTTEGAMRLDRARPVKLLCEL